jgi:polyhydroxyalkanoate synthesis regulator protein
MAPSTPYLSLTRRIPYYRLAHLLTATPATAKMLRNMMQNYSESLKRHTGLHYTPSFNDLCSNANDDMEDLELQVRAPQPVVSPRLRSQP